MSHKNLFLVPPPVDWVKRPLIVPGSNEPKPESDDAEQRQVDQWLELGENALKADEKKKSA